MRPVLTDLLRRVGGGFCDEYQTVYDAMTNKPSDELAEAQDTFFKVLVNQSVFSTRDVIYLFAQHSNADGEALINCRNPGTHDSTMVNSPTFTSLVGFTGDGSSAWLNHNILESEFTHYLLNDACQFHYISRSGTQNGMSGYRNYRNYLYIIGASTYLPTKTNTQVAVEDYTDGVFAGSRDNSANQESYNNKSTSTITSVSGDYINPEAMPPGWASLARKDANDTASQFATYTQSFFMAGSAMSKAQLDAVTDALEVLMDFSGKGVIS